MRIPLDKVSSILLKATKAGEEMEQQKSLIEVCPLNLEQRLILVVLLTISFQIVDHTFLGLVVEKRLSER